MIATDEMQQKDSLSPARQRVNELIDDRLLDRLMSAVDAEGLALLVLVGFYRSW
jgi:hypothetical protein